MIAHWTVFEGVPNGRRSELARITLGPNRSLQFNAHAYQAFGEPKAVEMLFDGNRKMMGLRPCDPQKKNAFTFRPAGGRATKNFRVSIGAFLTHFGIKPERTVLFEEIDISADGILTLDMTKTTVVSRGSR